MSVSLEKDKEQWESCSRLKDTKGTQQQKVMGKRWLDPGLMERTFGKQLRKFKWRNLTATTFNANNANKPCWALPSVIFTIYFQQKHSPKPMKTFIVYRICLCTMIRTEDHFKQNRMYTSNGVFFFQRNHFQRLKYHCNNVAIFPKCFRNC